MMRAVWVLTLLMEDGLSIGIMQQIEMSLKNGPAPRILLILIGRMKLVKEEGLLQLLKMK